MAELTLLLLLLLTLLLLLLLLQAKNAAPDLSQLPDPSELFGKAKGAANEASGKAKGAADQASGSLQGAAGQAKGSASGVADKVCDASCRCCCYLHTGLPHSKQGAAVSLLDLRSRMRSVKFCDHTPLCILLPVQLQVC